MMLDDGMILERSALLASPLPSFAEALALDDAHDDSQAVAYDGLDSDVIERSDSIFPSAA